MPKGGGFMAEVRIASLEQCARWSLRMPQALPVGGFAVELPINRASSVEGRLCARLGPDEWLLCAPEGTAPAFDALVGRHHSLVDVSHGYAGFMIEGDAAHLVLAAGCPLDLDPAAFTAGTATRTLLGKAEIVLWRLDAAPAFRVECARSFAPYVRAFLQEVAREFM
jgi:sarcosine oxidase subunit gamma